MHSRTHLKSPPPISTGGTGAGMVGFIQYKLSLMGFDNERNGIMLSNVWESHTPLLVLLLLWPQKQVW